jgi:hypothetical protein
VVEVQRADGVTAASVLEHGAHARRAPQTGHAIAGLERPLLLLAELLAEDVGELGIDRDAKLGARGQQHAVGAMRADPCITARVFVPAFGEAGGRG